MITTEWPTPDRPHCVPFLKRQVELLRSKGVDVYIFYFKGRGNPLNYVKAFFSLRKIIKMGNFQLIHAQWGQSAVPALGCGLPLVITFRGSDLYGITKMDGSYSLKGKLLKNISRFMAHRASHVILVAEQMRSKLSNIPQDRISVVPSGVNLNLFYPMDKHECRKRLNLSIDRKIIMFGGDPERPDKRFYLANKAISLIQNTLDVELLVVKEVPHASMPVYINASDVVLLTSKHEGSPNIVKEALACNCPVVSVDVGDVKQRLAGLNNCYVVNDTPEDIAQALINVLISDNLTDFRNTVLSLNEEALIDKVLNIYNSLIK
ncbi:MAG: glycosyltransferase [Flavobacteriales bacterium]|nr:glycosyltransferase [Flavobacteriales bacterium]